MQGQKNILLMLFSEHTLMFFPVSPERWRQLQRIAPGRPRA